MTWHGAVVDGVPCGHRRDRLGETFLASLSLAISGEFHMTMRNVAQLAAADRRRLVVEQAGERTLPLGLASGFSSCAR